MNIMIQSRHIEATDSIRQYVESKVTKLPRFYDNVQSIDVTLDLEAERPVVEIVVTARKKNTFVAKHRDEDMYACIDQCLHKITEQLRRHKDRVRDRQGLPHEQQVQGQSAE